MKKTNVIILHSLILSSLLACQKEKITNDTTDSPQQVETSTDLQSKVIYGSDGRQDYYELPDGIFKQMTQSTVALMKTSDLKLSGNQVVIKSQNFGSAMQLCSSERFREQNMAAFCSGSLVGEDLIMTAGHCITSTSDCATTSFVFGFAMSEPGVLPQSVAQSEVYKCASIVSRTLESGTGLDYALIKLDRKVANHHPLQINRSASIQVGDPLIVAGHPSGLPLKITTGGHVRSITNSKYFVASVDTYGGNSGSAVFNLNTGLIEGILVRGDQDFVSKNGCYISNVCQEDSCRGEDVTRVSMISQLIPELPSSPTDSTQPGSGTVDTGQDPNVDNPDSNTEVLTHEQFSSTQVLSIPDNKTSGVSSSLEVTSLPQNRQILLNVNISHTYIGDLVVKLITSDGRTLTLSNREGGSQDNLVKTFDLTEALKDLTQTGTFKLVVQDLAKYDKGQINSWSLEYKVNR